MTEPKFGSSGFACEHGQLARSCDICQYEARITSLEARNAELEESVRLAHAVKQGDRIASLTRKLEVFDELLAQAHSVIHAYQDADNMIGYEMHKLENLAVKIDFWCDHCGSGTDTKPPTHAQDCDRDESGEAP